MRIARKRVLVLDSSEVVGQWTERLRISSRPDDDSIVEKKKRKRLEETFHDFIYRLRGFSSRVFIACQSYTAIEIRGNKQQALDNFLAKCSRRRYLIDIVAYRLHQLRTGANILFGFT